MISPQMGCGEKRVHRWFEHPGSARPRPGRSGITRRDSDVSPPAGGRCPWGEIGRVAEACPAGLRLRPGSGRAEAVGSMIDLLPTGRLGAPGDADLPAADLSRWFNPFLSYFAQETVRSGGEVRLVRYGEEIVGIVLSDPDERLGTVFTRSRSLAETLVGDRGPCGFYCDVAISSPREVFDIFSSATAQLPHHQFQNPVRFATAGDLPAVIALLREENGGVNARWFQGLPTASEVGFVAEVGGRIAGIGWVSLVGAHARLHSLAVHLRYRGMGLGTDLLFARLTWARAAGAASVVSEISERNRASRSIAERAGMERVGETYLYPPARR